MKSFLWLRSLRFLRRYYTYYPEEPSILFVLYDPKEVKNLELNTTLKIVAINRMTGEVWTQVG
jgi:hypothetical protein